MRVHAVISVIAAVFLLAACESTPDESASTSGAGGSGATQPTTTMVVVESAPDPTPGSIEFFILNYGDRVFFDFDKSDLKPDARATVEGWAQFLREYPSVTFTIEGNCDERGTREYNLALGERRASAVRNYLVALGANPNRIATISYGKERPAVLGSNEFAWAQNRRSVALIN
jgi:peptidoglycan-associated lipoprotein